ncbi:MAG: LamG domain-containing protein [Verrucomicrobiaceae bacterium]|nr:MAG: LamG domain-containing protein [Verrucomicrobiaceae bacterium]
MKIAFVLTSVTALAALTPPSQAALVHLYTFNDGTANDSVGASNGVIVNPANAVFSNGVLNISANDGGGPGNNAYVDLPNGLFSSAVNGGTAGAASFSLWFTASENRNWAPALSFGTSNNGENTSDAGNAADYLQLIPSAGVAGNPLRLTTHAANNGTEGFLDTGTAAIGSLIQAVGVFDNGNFRFYVNGVQIGSTVAVASGLNLSSFNDNNNWLGRSQWGDPVFDGSYDQLSVYDHALTGEEVASSFASGPVPVPETSAAMLGVLGGASLLSARRRRPA